MAISSACQLQRGVSNQCYGMWDFYTTSAASKEAKPSGPTLQVHQPKKLDSYQMCEGAQSQNSRLDIANTIHMAVQIKHNVILVDRMEQGACDTVKQPVISLR